jgi:hypothetical protein
MALIAPPAKDEFLLVSGKFSIGNSKSQRKAKPRNAINTMRHRRCDRTHCILSRQGPQQPNWDAAARDTEDTCYAVSSMENSSRSSRQSRPSGFEASYSAGA